MTNLVLKRANASRSAGQWKEKDYDVLAEGKVVGRILEEGSRFGPPELRWGWSITAIVSASSATHGIAATLDEAKAMWQAARQSLHMELRPSLTQIPPACLMRRKCGRSDGLA
jgi:hypothetical protein